MIRAELTRRRRAAARVARSDPVVEQLPGPACGCGGAGFLAPPVRPDDPSSPLGFAYCGCLHGVELWARDELVRALSGT